VKPEGKKQLGRSNHGRMILKWILQKQNKGLD